MSTSTWNRDRTRSWSKRLGMGLTATALAATAVVTPAMVQAPASSATAVSNWADRGVTIHGRQWMGGRGVPVYRGRQCTELASRLYATKRWGHLSNFYGMKPYKRSGAAMFIPNGAKYRPVPGDVIVELGGPWQHVAVVDRVIGGRIFTTEQNAAASGRHIYNWNGRWATGAYRNRYVGGYIHSVMNPLSPLRRR